MNKQRKITALTELNIVAEGERQEAASGGDKCGGEKEERGRGDSGCVQFKTG